MKGIDLRMVQWRFGLLFILLGTVFFCIGIALSGDYILFRQGTISTTGKIIELMKSSDSNAFSPKCVFYDENHNEHVFYSRIYTNPPTGKVGDGIEIMYKKNNPSKARVKANSTVSSIIKAFTLYGSIIIVIGAFLLLNHKKWQKSRNISNSL